MPNWKKIIVSGSDASLNSLNVTAGVTGSLLGTASTASYVNTLNQNVIITGSIAVGTSSLGPNENTLTLGARDAGNEGGQLGLNAPGGTYTSASMIDNYTNLFRILKGTNASSTNLVAQWNLHTYQMQLPAYIGASSFTGSATANLAVDSSGNVITVSTSGGSVFPYTGNAVITGSLTTTGIISVPINGAAYFRGGDDAEFWDVNVANTVGIYGQQTQGVGAVKLGSGGPTLHGSGSNLGIGTTNPSSASLTVSGNVWANSFTGSFTGSHIGPLTGTASYATTASYSNTSTSASYALNATTSSYALTSTSASYSTNTTTASTASYVVTAQTASFYGGSVTSASYASNATTAQTASFYGGSVTSASYASNATTVQTASFVNPLNQNVVITGSASNSLRVKGSGATSSTNTLYLENSSNINTFAVADNGNVTINTGSLTVNQATGTGTGIILKAPTDYYSPKLEFNAIGGTSRIIQGYGGQLFLEGGNALKVSFGVYAAAGTVSNVDIYTYPYGGSQPAYPNNYSMLIKNPDTTGVNLMIRAASGQAGTGNITEWQNSGGTEVVAKITASGSAYFKSDITASSFSGSHIGPLTGTASYASLALTASYVATAQTASYYGGSVTSASYASNATSASYAPGGTVNTGTSAKLAYYPSTGDTVDDAANLE